jgi:hypothetical protein
MESIGEQKETYGLKYNNAFLGENGPKTANQNALPH